MCGRLSVQPPRRAAFQPPSSASPHHLVHRAEMAKDGGEALAERTPPRKVRRKVNQNVGTHWCWATRLDGTPCECKVPKDSNIPFCEHHLKHGDDALIVMDHPENHAVGKILIARFDLPKGYKMVYWGNRVRWRGCKGEDRAMSFLVNGGVIDPIDCTGQQLQFMACPGPGERVNTKCTDTCFGKTYDTRLVGREIVTTEDVPKNHQLLQWYGSKDWFEAREIDRSDVGTAEHPAPKRKKRKRKQVDKDAATEKENPPLLPEHAPLLPPMLEHAILGGE